MEEIKINLLNCYLHRILKPLQNLSIIGFTICWVVNFLILFIDNTKSILFSIFFLISGVLVVIFIVISLVFLKKKRIGTLEICKNKMVYKDKTYDLNDCFLDLNRLENTKITKEDFDSLPFWGNYIVTNDLHKIEFEPTLNSFELVNRIRLQKKIKRSFLSMKTTEFFSWLMDLLWVVS